MYCYLKNQCDSHVCLGEGAFAKVNLALDVNTNTYVAIKTIFDRNNISEMAIHKNLNHPNIIRMLDYQTDVVQKKTSLVLEYADDGNLQDKIREQLLDRNDVKTIFRDICLAVKYLHDRCIIHGDIKPQNIVMMNDGTAKLCDFGSASLFGQQRTSSGTLEYMSPESVLGFKQNYKIDVWSLGILLFEMISGETPFKGQSKDDIIRDMKKTMLFGGIFNQVEIDLIKKILRVNPEHRPELKYIISHRYFRMEQDKISSGVSTEGCQEDLGMRFISEPYHLVAREEGDQLFKSKEQQLQKIRRQYRLKSHQLTQISKML